MSVLKSRLSIDLRSSASSSLITLNVKSVQIQCIMHAASPIEGSRNHGNGERG